MPSNSQSKQMAHDRQQEVQEGKELHREFVGMLFALAIAQVVSEAAIIPSGQLSVAERLPAYTHLMLAAMVVVTSWVGWGRSASNSSFIEGVFSCNFIELMMDLWLVACYFFLAKGVELPTNGRIASSLSNEATWILVIFTTYLMWDFWTKVVDVSGQDRTLTKYLGRGWASIACALLALLAYRVLPRAGEITAAQAVLGDASLLALVLLFRAMKSRNFIELTRGWWCLIGGLFVAFLLALDLAARVTPVGKWFAANVWL